MKPKSKKATKPTPAKTEASSTVISRTVAAPATQPLKLNASPAPVLAAVRTQPASIDQPSAAAVSQPLQASKAQPHLIKPGKVTLEYVKPGASRVLVAGSFNGWKPEATPLTPLGNGRWSGSLDVEPGKYEYLFVVDGSWILDPNAAETVANPFGGLNSVLTVNN